MIGRICPLSCERTTGAKCAPALFRRENQQNLRRVMILKTGGVDGIFLPPSLRFSARTGRIQKAKPLVFCLSASNLLKGC